MSGIRKPYGSAKSNLESCSALYLLNLKNRTVENQQEVFDHLRKNCYRKLGVTPNACHPRALIAFIIDNSRYYRHHPRLTKEGITEAWNNYFVEK